ncbi:MAG: outer membrane lipoprotein carrier protein LolA [Gemmatimonadetes bacterium]|nr:outer membrane lipoprotein carrier protein LolA [Gemmatimonadota bacterium]MYB60586.1 outer membrane lipoprotein carrier protein LolA [Gemmatimonadota bacterium]MYB62969.1 outer membrane lipoprotein carrier protein LolA [Gemmatimonadota bacterium]
MAAHLWVGLLTGLFVMQGVGAPGSVRMPEDVGSPEDVGPLRGFVAPEQPHTAEIVTGKMRQRLDGVRSLAARYTVTTFAAVLESRSETEGKLYLQRDRNRLRLEEAGQTIVSDGETLWTYVPGNRQVIVSPAGEEGTESGPGRTSRPGRPDDFIFNYSNRYLYALEGREPVDGMPCSRLRLTAVEPADGLPDLRIWVDEENWLTRKVTYTDDMGSETTLRFMDYRLNEKLAPGLFEMTVPEGVEWVDLR